MIFLSTQQVNEVRSVFNNFLISRDKELFGGSYRNSEIEMTGLREM